MNTFVIYLLIEIIIQVLSLQVPGPRSLKAFFLFEISRSLFFSTYFQILIWVLARVTNRQGTIHCLRREPIIYLVEGEYVFLLEILVSRFL